MVFFKERKSTVRYFVIINKVTLRLLWKGKRLKKANTMLKKIWTKSEDWHYPTLRLTLKLQKWIQCGTGKNSAKQTKNPRQTERSMNQDTKPRNRHTTEPTDLWREQRQSNGERTAFQQTCWDWTLTCQNRKNGTPFQYSCLENPMDGGAQ